jgi:hypothetical protein
VWLGGRLQLRIAGTEQRLGITVFHPVGQYLRMSVQHNPTQQCPVFIVPVDDERDRRIL